MRNEGWSGRSVVIFAVGAIIFLIVTRAPQLASPKFMLDTDECVLGLMSKHLVSDGIAASLFFSGQQYGLSLLEAAAGALFFEVAPTPLMLKLAMLALFTFGCAIFTCNLARKFGFRIAAAGTLLFLGMPAWILWSMKARGGYLTAFLVGQIMLAVLWRRLARRTVHAWMAIGMLAAILTLAQPIWMVAYVPILLASLIGERNWNSWMSFSVGGGGTAALLSFARQGSVNYRPELIELSAERALFHIPRVFFESMTGGHFFGGQWVGPAAAIGAAVWCATLVVLVVRKLLAPWDELQSPGSLAVCGILLLLACGAMLSAKGVAPRYFLPCAELMVIALCTELARLAPAIRRQILRFLLPAVLVVGMVAGFEMRNLDQMRPQGRAVPVVEADALAALLAVVESSHAVLSLDRGLVWQIIFYGGEKVTAFADGTVERVPKLKNTVCDAARSDPAIPLVGYLNQLHELENRRNELEIDPALSKLEIVAERYFVLAPAPRVLIGEICE